MNNHEALLIACTKVEFQNKDREVREDMRIEKAIMNKKNKFRNQNNNINNQINNMDSNTTNNNSIININSHHSNHQFNNNTSSSNQMSCQILKISSSQRDSLPHHLNNSSFPPLQPGKLRGHLQEELETNDKHLGDQEVMLTLFHMLLIQHRMLHHKLKHPMTHMVKIVNQYSTSMAQWEKVAVSFTELPLFLVTCYIGQRAFTIFGRIDLMVVVLRKNI